MRVVVDRDRCEGNAFCVNIAPDVFELDDDEYAVVLTDPVPPSRKRSPSRPSPRVSRAIARRLGAQRGTRRITLTAKGFPD